MGLAIMPFVLSTPGNPNLSWREKRGFILLILLVVIAVPVAVVSLKYATLDAFHFVHKRALFLYVLATLTWTSSLIIFCSLYDYRLGFVVNQDNAIKRGIMFGISIGGMTFGYGTAVVTLLCAAIAGHFKQKFLINSSARSRNVR
jgi:hypothetical protein